MANERDITIARLRGRSGYHITHHTRAADAIADVRTISTDPVLLGLAAGQELGSYRYDEIKYAEADLRDALLLAAGADETERDLEAAKTYTHLNGSQRGGIGHR